MAMGTPVASELGRQKAPLCYHSMIPSALIGVDEKSLPSLEAEKILKG